MKDLPSNFSAYKIKPEMLSSLLQRCKQCFQFLMRKGTCKSLSLGFTQITCDSRHQCCQVLAERNKTLVVIHLCRIPTFLGFSCVRIQSRRTSCWSFSIIRSHVGKIVISSLFFSQCGHLQVVHPSVSWALQRQRKPADPLDHF